MGGPSIDTLRISPNYTSKDWQKLDRTRRDDWSKAADIVKDRLCGRFLRYADDALSSPYSGFVVLVIDSLLLETMQQFREGYTAGSGESARMIKECLESRRFQPAFDERARMRYYKDIRCGLLHQAEAKRMWLIRREQPSMLQKWSNGNGYTLDVKLFHKAVSDTLHDYVLDISRTANCDLRENLWRKMSHICNVRTQRGAEYADETVRQ